MRLRLLCRGTTSVRCDVGSETWTEESNALNELVASEPAAPSARRRPVESLQADTRAGGRDLSLMASNYREIRRDNELRYGTDIGRIGPMLLADRYDDRTHFIFELLQNAEDALARRSGWQSSRAVSFQLTQAALRVGHFGQPFDQEGVRGICGIAETTKDLTAIGRRSIPARRTSPSRAASGQSKPRRPTGIPRKPPS